MYPAERRVTLSNNFKLCGGVMWVMTRRRVMYPALPVIAPLGNNTAGVSNACIAVVLPHS